MLSRIVHYLLPFFLLLLILVVSGKAEAQAVVIGHPADTAVCVGGQASFRVIAVNAISYQWQENDGVGWYNITQAMTYASGYNSPLLTISDANLGLNGYKYRCVVADGQGQSDVSQAANFGVNNPPLITLQPQDKVVCKGDIAQFAVSSIYGQTYQWQESVGQGWIDLEDNAFYQGTRSPQLSIYTTTGMNGFRYRCRILNGNCPEISNVAFLFVNPTPVLFQVTGGGSFCADGQGVVVGLNGSEVGISYHLYRNGTGTGVVVPGTGAAITFGQFSQAGFYSVKAINGGTGCEIFMLNEVEVRVDPLPQQYSVLGGGSYCSGGQAPEVFLSSSELGVSYELFRNGLATGIIRNGTGFTLSFGSLNESGFYTIVATNASTFCSRQMSGNAQIIQQPVPQVLAANDLTIGVGESAMLSAAATGGSGAYVFQWQPASYVVNPTQATTSTIPLYQTRLFTVVARDLTSQCVSPPDSLLVVVAGGPLTVSITASSSAICAGEQVQLQATAGGGNGTYTYVWTSTPAGFTATGPNVSVSPQSTTTYHLQVSDGSQSISSSVTVTVHPLPILFSLTGGGGYCQGGEGRLVGLTGSQYGTRYDLLRDGQVVSSFQGDESPLNFGPQALSGIYTAKAVYVATQCQRMMGGQAEVTVIPLPVANAGPNQSIQSGQSALLNGSASGGSGSYLFSWSPESFLINPNSAQAATVPLTGTRLFKLRVTDQQTSCSSAESETVVFVTGGVSLSAQLSASSYSICPGESVQLTALASGGSGNYTYSWTSNPPGFASQQFNPSVGPSQTTTYKVVIIDGFATFTDSLTIVVRPAPQIFQLTGGGTYCQGAPAPELGLSGSQGNVIYSLFRNGEATGLVRQGTGTAISFGAQAQNGVYSVQAFDLQQLCARTFPGQVSVGILQRPVADAGNDKTIPFGTSTILQGTATSGSGVYAYAWSPQQLVAQPTAAQTPTLPLTQTTTFSLNVTDQTTGCASLPVAVTVVVTGNPLTATASASQNQVCQGNMVQLNGYATGGNGNYTYHWSSIPSGFYSWEQQVQLLAYQSSTYVLTVSDGVNTAQDTIAIQVLPVPQVFALQGGGLVCPGSNLPEIRLSGSQSAVRYTLVRDGSEVASLTGNGSAIVFGQFSQPGNYTAYARTLPAGCEINMSGAVTVAAGNTILVNAGPDKVIPAGTQVTLEGQVIAGGVQFQVLWEPAGKLINPQAVQPTTLALDETSLFRMTAAAQAGGCGVAEDYVVVFVENTATTLQLNVVSSQQAICPGSEVSLFALASGGTGAYTYVWRSVPEGLTFFGNQLMVSPDQTTRYVVTVNDGQTQVSDSVEVTVRAAPQVYALSGGGYLCEGGSGLAINLSGSESGTMYELRRYGIPTGQSLPGTGLPITFADITLPGEYTIRATSQSGCSRLMQGQVAIQSALRPLALVNPLQQIQPGEHAQLAASVAGNQQYLLYQWTPANLVSSPTSLITTSVPMQQTTMFLFTATDTQTGCVSYPAQSLVVVTGLPLTAAISASSAAVCQGDTLVLTALPEGGTGTYSYTWHNSSGQLLGNGAQLVYAPTQTDQLTLTINDGQQQATALQTIEVNPHPQVFEISGGGSYCASGSPAPIQLSGSETGVIYTLYRNHTQILMQVPGTGGPLVFGEFNLQGVYTVSGQRLGTACVSLMAGSVVVNQFSPPQVQSNPSFSVPYGGAVLLTAAVSAGSGNYAYQWQPASKVVNPSQLQTMTVALEATQVFTLTVTDVVSGCASIAQTVVYVSGGPLNALIFSNAVQVCPGQGVRLTAMPQGGSGQYAFEWWSVPPGLQSTQASIEVYPAVTSWYYLRVSDGTQQRTDSLRVLVFPQPTAFTIGGGGAGCAGGPGLAVTLSGSQTGTNYSLLRDGFATGRVLTGTGAALVFNNIQAAGTYTVRATNQSGCISLMNGSAVVELASPPAAYHLFGGGAACANEDNIAIFLTGSETGVNYRLLRNGTDLVQEKTGTGLPVTFITPVISGTYIVEAQSAGAQCVAVMPGTAQVLRYPVPLPMINGPEEVCQGGTVTLTASGGLDYQWLTYPPVSGPVLQLTPVQSDNYTVRVANGFGCVAEATASVLVNPLPVFELQDDVYARVLRLLQVEAGSTITFRNAGQVLQQGFSATYNYGGLSFPNDTIHVQAVSAKGCVWSDYAVLRPEAQEFRLNAFSPNGDQINDRFMAGSQIRVFNRWGVEIYSGSDGWDGRYNGSLVSPGTYYYVHEIRDLSGAVVRIVKGSVTLVRE